jgi:hypothetical protein
MTDSIDATRAQLESTLDAIEDRLNVPKQVGRLRSRAVSSYQANPIPWIVGATAAVIAIGGLVRLPRFGFSQRVEGG